MVANGQEINERFVKASFNKDTNTYYNDTTSVRFYFSNNLFSKFYLWPDHNYSDVKNCVAIYNSNSESSIKTIKSSLEHILVKYKEWKEIATQNNVDDFEKSMADSLFSWPKMTTYITTNDRIWEGVLAFAPFFVKKGNMMFVRLYQKKNKFTSARKVDNFFTSMAALSGAGFDDAMLGPLHLTFSTEEQIQSLILALDLEKAKSSLQLYNQQKEKTDSLFK